STTSSTRSLTSSWTASRCSAAVPTSSGRARCPCASPRWPDPAMAQPNTGFDSRTFRHVLGHFATGVAVISADGPDGPAAMLVSSFTSVSLEPPLVAFLPDKSSTSWPAIRAAGSFCVNILSAGQQELCAQFARKGGNKFEGVKWTPAPSGAPVLDGVMAWIDCELTQTFESGDHYIAIGRVLQL